MRTTARSTLGITLTAALVLGTGGTALAGEPGEPDERASCVAAITSAYAPEGARDDLQQLHNQVFKDVLEVAPGLARAAVGHVHGTQEECLLLLPPGLVVPPHP